MPSAFILFITGYLPRGSGARQPRRGHAKGDSRSGADARRPVEPRGVYRAERARETTRPPEARHRILAPAVFGPSAPRRTLFHSCAALPSPRRRLVAARQQVPSGGGWCSSRCRRATPSLLASAACMCQSRRVARRQGRLLPRKQFPPVSPAAAPRRSPCRRGAGTSPGVRAGAREWATRVAKRRRRGAVVARGSDVSIFPATATPTALGVATAPAGLRVGLEAEAAPLAESRMAMERAKSVAAFLPAYLEL
jgi:hypothetical protein